MKFHFEHLFYGLILLVFNSCTDCAPDQYTNYHYDYETFRDINRYKEGDEYLFINKTNNFLQYKLRVINRELIEKEYLRDGKESYAPICPKAVGNHHYTTRFDETLLKFDGIPNKHNSKFLGISMGNPYTDPDGLYNQNLSYVNRGNIFLIHTNRLSRIPSFEADEMNMNWDWLSGAYMGMKEGQLDMSYNLYSNFQINGRTIENVYRIDTLKYLDYSNSNVNNRQIYFKEVAYSMDFGFLRFITLNNDTLDLAL